MEGGDPISKRLATETRIARGDRALDADILELGPPSPYTCPECHGVLVQLQDGCFTRFRCHTGHAYSLSSLLADVTQSLEHFLWSTVRTMEESILLLRHLAQYGRGQQATQVAEVAERKVRDAERSTQLIRDLLRQHEPLSEDRLCHDPG
jgi:two-component system, chemotaxis family, protein-glutamate methylesterase/glutaminase